MRLDHLIASIFNKSITKYQDKLQFTHTDIDHFCGANMLFRKRLTLPLLTIAILMLLFLSQQHPDSLPVTEAQSSAAACDQLVQTALESVANNCLDIGRNEVCYGNRLVSATFADPDDPNNFFEAPGDIVSLTALDAIITRPVDIDSDEWGIALMDLAADLPDGDDSMRIVLFGDVEVAPVQPTLVENVPTCTYTNTADSSMNMRSGPGTAFSPVDILEQGDSVVIMGQDSSGDWVRSSRGWVYEPFGTLVCGSTTLRTIENTDDSYVAPMQSFSLQINEDAQCQTAPSGMLVQTPSGQTANIMVNNIEVRVGSTAFIGLPLEPNEDETIKGLVVATIEGNVSLTIGRQTQGLVAGTQIEVATDAEGTNSFVTARTPFDASAYHLDDLLSSTLPISVPVPPPVGITSGSGGSAGGSSGGNRLAVANVRCQVGQNPGSAAQYFSSDNATITSISTRSSGSGAATKTLETLVTSRSISYQFHCNAVGTTTFTTTITDSRGRTVTSSFTVTVR